MSASNVNLKYSNCFTAIEFNNLLKSHLSFEEKYILKLLGIRITNVQSNGYPLKRKPVIMRRKHVWFVERMWAENPTTIQTRFSKETKKFSRMVIGSSAVDLL